MEDEFVNVRTEMRDGCKNINDQKGLERPLRR